jgi:hypothetical protein
MHLLPFFGERRRMVTIGTPDIRRFIAERQREDIDADGMITKRAAKPAEINRELAAVRRAFNLAVQAGRLIDRPHFRRCLDGCPSASTIDGHHHCSPSR